MSALLILLLLLAGLLMLTVAPRGWAAWRRHAQTYEPKARAHAHPLYVLASAKHYAAALAAAARPDEVRRVDPQRDVPDCVFVHPELTWAVHWDMALRSCMPLSGLTSHGVVAQLRALTRPQTPAQAPPRPDTPDPGILAGPSAVVRTALEVAGPSRNALAAWRLAIWLRATQIPLSPAPYEVAYLAGDGTYVPPSDEEHALAWQEVRAGAWPSRAEPPPLPYLLKPA